MNISIVIVDDNPQNRVSLEERMKYAKEIDPLFTANDGIDFLDQMKKLLVGKLPQVVLMDIEMPGLNGIDTIRQARILYPDVKFLVLTVFDDEEKIFEAIQAGASGYLLKDEKVAVIIEWIHELVEIGGAPMSPRIARKAMNLLMNMKPEYNKEMARDSPLLHELSDREIEVLKLLVDGYDYKATAEKLFLSTHTVRKHIANIYHKLHVNSKAQALRIAYMKGLI